MFTPLVHFGWVLPMHTASALEVSVCNGVANGLCRTSSKVILMYTASFITMYNDANSAYVVGDMISFIMCAMVSTAPILSSIGISPEKKHKLPPALLLALFLEVVCTIDSNIAICLLLLYFCYIFIVTRMPLFILIYC